MTELIEHIDDRSATVIYSFEEGNYDVRFFVAEVAAWNGDALEYTRADANSKLDLIADPHHAERYFAGSVKWDGCSNIHFGDKEGYMHNCSRADLEALSRRLVIVFNRCGELLDKVALKDVFK
jgi:hypothetical protein